MSYRFFISNSEPPPPSLPPPPPLLPLRRGLNMDQLQDIKTRFLARQGAIPTDAFKQYNHFTRITLTSANLSRQIDFFLTDLSLSPEESILATDIKSSLIRHYELSLAQSAAAINTDSNAVLAGTAPDGAVPAVSADSESGPAAAVLPVSSADQIGEYERSYRATNN